MFYKKNLYLPYTMKYIIDRCTHQLHEKIDINEMLIHYQSCKDLSSKNDENKKQEQIDKMISAFNSQLDWDNKRIKAYFDAVDYIINGGFMDAKSKIEKASQKGYYETNLIEFSRDTIISPNNTHNIKLLGMIYHTKYNNFYLANKLPYLIDLIKNILMPYNIVFWKPKKNLWVIQAKWNNDTLSNFNENDTKINSLIEYVDNNDSSTDDNYYSDESDDSINKINYSIDKSISSSLLYNNSIWNEDENNIDKILPIYSNNNDKIELNKLPTILEWTKSYSV
jgi:hypothetical protein